MAAAGIGNPVGHVQVLDGGQPRNVTGYVHKTVISGGVFCYASGAEGVVSSGTNSLVATDIGFEPNASGAQFNGIALQDAASGAPITVTTHGVFLLVCNGSVMGGTMVTCDGNNSVRTIGYDAESGALGAYYAMGRALTDGASGGYAVIQVGL